MSNPIEGQVILLAGAKASVPLRRLPTLLSRAAVVLSDRRESYDRRYERLHEDDDRRYYAVESDHWTGLGDELGFDDRETDAVRRAHTEQLLRAGRRADRREEFQTTLEIRECVVIERERE